MKFQQIIKLHRENNKKTNNYCIWLEKVTNYVFAPFSNLRSNTNSHLKILTKLDGQMVPWSIRPSRWIKNKTHHKTAFYLKKTVQNGTTSCFWCVLLKWQRRIALFGCFGAQGRLLVVYQVSSIVDMMARKCRRGVGDAVQHYHHKVIYT